MTRVPHTLEPVLKFLSRGREIALDTVRLFFYFLLSAIRFLTNITGVFAHSSILSTRSTVFETLRKERELDKDRKLTDN